jgi:cell fate regulator YaaT (PSP1 superfamily)
LREFEPVVTQFAKEQNLALNPTKLSGACGRLMCCLLYERQFYAEALKKFPAVGARIRTAKGTGTLTKIDIFEESAVIQHANEEEEKILLTELKQLVQNEPKKLRFGQKKKKKNPNQNQRNETVENQENPGH